MRTSLLLFLIALALGCVSPRESIIPEIYIPKVPENYSAVFSTENYSLGEIELNISHPMIIQKFRWGKMSIKIFLDKTEMRDLDLQDLKKAMAEWEANTSGKISFGITENYSESDVYVNWLDDEKLKIRGGSLILGEASPPAAVWTGLFYVPAKGSIAKMELLTVYRRWSPATYLRPMHELGHVLGLDHPRLNDISVMHNFSYYGQRFTDDIKQLIDELYKTPAEPDLAFENISAEQKGAAVHYNLIIENRGVVESGDYEIIFYSENKTFWKQNMSSLEPAYSQYLEGYFPVDSGIEEFAISIATNETEIFSDNNKIILRKI